MATAVCLFNRLLEFGYDEVVMDSKLVSIPKAAGLDIRALSLLPTVRKLLEKCVLNRINGLGDRLHESQSGFRTGMSPLRSLLRIDLEIQRARRTGELLIVKCYDVEKAFDSVPRALVAMRLREYIGPAAPRLGLLAEQMLSVSVRGWVGPTPIMMQTGVPQGGFLSPLAYVVADNSLCLSLGDTISKFADDNTTICRSARPIHPLCISELSGHRGFEIFRSLRRTVRTR